MSSGLQPKVGLGHKQVQILMTFYADQPHLDVRLSRDLILLAGNDVMNPKIACDSQ